MFTDAAEEGRPAGWAAVLLETCRQALFPARCLSCRAFLESGPGRIPPAAGLWAEAMARLQPYFCRACLQALVPLAPPLCACCGTTVGGGGDGAEPLCANCREQPPAFDRARAAFAYQGSLRAVVHCLKYRGKTQLARPLGGLMHSVYRDAWPSSSVDLILPVPLHRRRLRERGFNQAVELARPLARRLGIPLAVDLVERVRAGRPQSSLQRSRRQANVRGAFALRRPLDAWHVAVVDDVLTTGASAAELASILRRAGAERVEVWVVARTPP
mgnify:CR=1 FL=1